MRIRNHVPHGNGEGKPVIEVTGDDIYEMMGMPDEADPNYRRIEQAIEAALSSKHARRLLCAAIEDGLAEFCEYVREQNEPTGGGLGSYLGDPLPERKEVSSHVGE